MSYYNNDTYARSRRSYGSYARSGAKTLFSNIPITWWLVIAVFVYGYVKGKSSGSWFGWLFNSSDDDDVNDSLPPDEFFDSDDVPPNNYTITTTQADAYVQDLIDAFNAVDFDGTDISSIETIVYNINHWDLGLIHERFGTPDYFLVGSGGILGGTPSSLKDWIVNEIDSQEPVYIQLKKMYKKINIHLP